MPMRKPAIPGPVEKANAWYNQHKWLTGANYIPSNAINQLEMWQADTFSPDLIDTEFALAEGIGFNTMRVFLHSIAWKTDAKGFKERIGKFLEIAHKHGIQPIFVFFDDCGNGTPMAGRQPEPKTGVHNSGWVHDPGVTSVDEAIFPELEKYVKDIITTFAKDQRILAWDVYNEPAMSGKGERSLPLVQVVFKWARASNPEQPITSVSASLLVTRLSLQRNFLRWNVLVRNGPAMPLDIDALVVS
jgi:endo-1,4-beta-mannosidase